ncbi:Right-handed parallel beta-helix repeat-containing protein [Aphelenchoides fujianensis]|nr:Right-handed parallel beta-helix repeat-containing protein [Aphelenchoides fujianensis]
MKAVCVILLGATLSFAFDTAKYPVPDTNFAPPAGALFVALTGNDANAGTQAAPLRNPVTAIKKAAAGSTVVVRAGVYYGVDLGTINKKFILQAYPHEQVYFLGSVRVTAWTKEKTYWKAAFTNTLPNITCPPEIINASHPTACLPEQVFLNGAPLVQVISLSRVTAGKFFQPTGGKWVYIGSDPSGKVVEVTKLVRGLNVNPAAAGSFVRGIAFAHYGSFWDANSAAILSSAENMTYDRCLITQNAARGMKLARPNQIIRASVFSFNGLLGLGGNRAHGVKLISNTFTRNNFERFRAFNCGGYCTTSGVKFSHTANALIDNNTFVNNHAGGMWFDDGCTDGFIIRNWFAGNERNGVSVEVSARAVVASNVFTRNGASGVWISGSDHVRIYNNDFAANANFHLQIQDDNRITCEFEQYSCQLNLTWDTSNIVIRNNLFSNNVLTGLVITGSEQAPVDKFIEAMDHNGWYRTNSTGVNFCRWCGIKGTASTCVDYATHTEFMNGRKIDYAPPSIGVRDTPTNPFFVNEAAGNFNLKPTSAARGAGTPLPADIAAALGVAASPVDMGKDSSIRMI